MKIRHALGVTLFFILGSAQAALVDRGGGLIYDADQDVTWLMDANYAQTSGYSADGLLTLAEAVTWLDGLNYYDSVRGVTHSNWRLAHFENPDLTCSNQNSIASYGFGCEKSELQNLVGQNTALLDNFSGSYWTDGVVASIYSNYVSSNGYSNYNSQTSGYRVFAVMDGDASLVPIPAAVWLFGSALGGLGFLRRRKSA